MSKTSKFSEYNDVSEEMNVQTLLKATINMFSQSLLENFVKGFPLNTI